MTEATSPLKLFFCYAREDKAFRDELELHLSNLKRQGLLSIWHDHMIAPGEEWEKVIDAHLNEADLVALLVSPHFMASDYCYSTEMTRALQRHATGDAYVIPILLRPVDWTHAPFSKIQLLPSNTHAITRWPDRDSAFEDVVRGIRMLIEKKQAQLQQAQSTLAHYNENLALCEEAIRADPTNAVAYGAKGYVLVELDQMQEALAPLEEAIRLDPTYSSAYFNKGKALAVLGRREEALVALNEAIRLNKASDHDTWKMPILYQTQAYVLSSLNRYEEALTAFEETIRLDPTISTSHSGISDVFHSLNRNEEAIQAADEAIRLDPNNAAAYRYKGNSMLDLEHPQAAIEAFDQAISLDPTSVEAYNNKGKALALLGRLQESLTAYDQAIQLAPDNPTIRRSRHHVVEALKDLPETS